MEYLDLPEFRSPSPALFTTNQAHRALLRLAVGSRPLRLQRLFVRSSRLKLFFMLPRARLKSGRTGRPKQWLQFWDSARSVALASIVRFDSKGCCLHCNHRKRRRLKRLTISYSRNLRITVLRPS